MFLEPYPPPVCMEEAEEPAGGGIPHFRHFSRRSNFANERSGYSDEPFDPTTMSELESTDTGGGRVEQPVSDYGIELFITRLMDERKAILSSNLSARDKVSLLETGRFAMSAVTGRSVRVFKSENVVYAILLFSLVVLLCLALLTAYSGLPKEVTIAFVGTVVGGTTATVAQKLGRL